VNERCKSKADGSVCKSMFVRMDVHKTYLQLAVLDENGKMLNNSRVDNNLNKIAKYFHSLNRRNSTKIVMESSRIWYSIYQCLNEGLFDVRLSNPAKNRAIALAKIKTDKLQVVISPTLLEDNYDSLKKEVLFYD
jgi:transposase